MFVHETGVGAPVFILLLFELHIIIFFVIHRHVTDHNFLSFTDLQKKDVPLGVFFLHLFCTYSF